MRSPGRNAATRREKIDWLLAYRSRHPVGRMDLEAVAKLMRREGLFRSTTRLSDVRAAIARLSDACGSKMPVADGPAVDPDGSASHLFSS